MSHVYIYIVFLPQDFFTNPGSAATGSRNSVHKQGGATNGGASGVVLYGVIGVRLCTFRIRLKFGVGDNTCGDVEMGGGRVSRR